MSKWISIIGVMVLAILYVPSLHAQQSTSGVSQSGRLDLTGRPPFPAVIQVMGNPEFREPSGNRALDALESGTLFITLRNASPFKGDVYLKITPLTAMDRLTLDRDITVGVMEGNTEQTITVPVSADMAVATAERRLRIEVIEAYYRNDPPPIIFSFNTLAFRPPEFHIVLRDLLDTRGPDFPLNNNDGRISAQEVVQFKIGVQNIGPGVGENARAEVTIPGEGNGIYYNRDKQGNSDHTFQLGSLDPGDHDELSFYLFTNPFFKQDELRIQVAVHEKHGRYGSTKTITIPIDLPVQIEQLIAVKPMDPTGMVIDKLASGLVDVEKVPTGSKTRMTDGVAIIIGIETYRHTFEAQYKRRDATVFYDYCWQVLGIPDDRILLRIDEDATKAEFDYIFEPAGSSKDGWLKKRVISNTTDIVIYLGGHGFPDLATGRPYFIPQDVRPSQATNGVALDVLYQTLSEMNPRSVTMFVESCFSGQSGYQAEPQALVANMNPVFWTIESSVIDPRFAVFTASSGTQASYNRDDLKHGIFTYYVLKALGGAADTDGDRAVTIAEMLTYLGKEVARKALAAPIDKEQHPSLLPPPDVLGDRMNRVLVQY